MLYVWYPEHGKDWVTFHEEKDGVKTEELEKAKKQLKQGKQTCFLMRTEHPRDCEIHD